VKNRHGKSWDRFSIYLTIRDQHLREIEALLLRIANPPGIKQRGRLAQSSDMRRRIEKAIHERQYSEVSSLFGRRTTPVEEPEQVSLGDERLIRLLSQGGRIRGTLKNRTFRARIRRNGQVVFKGKRYNSLSFAAFAALRRPTNGWWFWQVERGPGDWVRLEKIRKAGTPVYIR
jgi:hypothetical protein